MRAAQHSPIGKLCGPPAFARVISLANGASWAEGLPAEMPSQNLAQRHARECPEQSVKVTPA
jgi:formylmethanofuran dehydrogenase subunit E-like metal-binding protein